MEQQDTCSICTSQPEDLLILQCRHHLCIDCATQVYSLSSKPNIICCEICLTETVLDRETIKCLKQINKPSHLNHRLPPKPHTNRISNNSQNICNQHGQCCIYYCFDCQTYKICSECILTTKHLNHKVSTIKNALKNINKKLIEHSKAKQSAIQRLNVKKSQVQNAKDSLISELDDKKSQLKIIFDEIVRIVSDKYNDLNRELQTHSKRNIQILQGLITTIEDKIQRINQSIDYQKMLINTDKDIEIIKYYSQAKLEHTYHLSNDLNDISNTALVLNHTQNIIPSIKEIINMLSWQEQELNKDYSIIQKQKLGKSRFRQSSKSRISQSFSNNTRKLELSRSITNATNIINKLQSRIKNH